MEKRSSKPLNAAPNSTSLIGVKPPKKAHILVVDDEKTNVEVLSRFLTREGYEVTPAGDGAEALKKVNASTPDLILLDIVMPVMDGLALCRIFRSDVTRRSLPIIFLTPRNTLEDRLQGLQAGVDDYIGKPFNLEEVKARLEGPLQPRRQDLA